MKYLTILHKRVYTYSTNNQKIFDRKLNYSKGEFSCSSSKHSCSYTSGCCTCCFEVKCKAPSYAFSISRIEWYALVILKRFWAKSDKDKVSRAIRNTDNTCMHKFWYKRVCKSCLTINFCFSCEVNYEWIFISHYKSTLVMSCVSGRVIQSWSWFK